MSIGNPGLIGRSGLARSLASEEPGAGSVGRGRLAGLLLAGGCLNGLVAQAEGNWRVEGADTILQFFGFGFFVPFSIYVGMTLMSSARVPPRATGIAALLFALPVLAPSSLVAWVAVAVYAVFVAVQVPPASRFGPVIFFGLALVMIWTSAGIKAVMDLVTGFDAVLVQQALAMIGISVVRSGNLLTSPIGHDIVILMDCATLKRLPLGLLSCVSASLLTGRILPLKPLCIALFAVALALTTMNTLRLTLLSTSPEAYAIVHGTLGKSVYDAIETLFVICAGLALGESRLARPLPIAREVSA